MFKKRKFVYMTLTMKHRLILPLLLLTFLMACEKDKFQTVPQLDSKSISPSIVFQGDIIRFVSEFTDKEGDLDSLLIVYKWYADALVTKADTFRYNTGNINLPPKTTDGDIIIEFSYGSQNDPFPILGSVVKDTTSTFGLIVIDKAGQRSNYIESKPIRLLKP
jgi:hypothetical protein